MEAKIAAQTTGKTIAYLRVSTLDQDIEKNKADILHFANDRNFGKVHFVEEVASGRKPWRERKIAEVLEELQDGDAIIVAELSRLGRSMLECMEILALAMRKSICVYAVKGNWRLDNSIQSKIIALAFSMAAEIERDLISQRTKEALRFKKEQGVILGRPKGPGKSKLDAFRPEIESLLANGSSQKFIAQRYHTTGANLHNWIKKHSLKTVKSHAVE
ncbi:recombinase family protein [Sulfuriferula nivalis]|uniref:Resolvase n=1 Tax=Sulfuriferula nivalis TaxID=2675298 RepID=A0A809RNC9_9PROT|nr:recombinase family protein [Sulfuriferula nivalis]BBP02284.1 resolvase [Sulfuriferula nivalis]